MGKYFGYAQCNECKDVEGPWILVGQRFLCKTCYEKLVEEKVKKEREQLFTSKTESSTMTKPIGLSCDSEVPTGQAALDSEITSPSLRDWYIYHEKKEKGGYIYEVQKANKQKER